MRPLRRRLSWLLSLWLIGQLVALAAPAVLAAAGSTPVEQLCTCPGGDHETCPMHHGTASTQPPTSDCAMSSRCAPADVALLSMAGGIGVLPVAVTIATPQTVLTVAPHAHPTLDLSASLETPPPRA
jgi:hypothetical protein